MGELLAWGKVVVISPHLDDALLSAHEIVRRTRAEVWTVLAGDPARPISTAWDNRCGFSDSRAAMMERRAEDKAACAEVGATWRHLDGLDVSYSTPSRQARDLHQLQRRLLELTQREKGPLTVVLPACAGVDIAPPLHERAWVASALRLMGARLRVPRAGRRCPLLTGLDAGWVAWSDCCPTVRSGFASGSTG